MKKNKTISTIIIFFIMICIICILFCSIKIFYLIIFEKNILVALTYLVGMMIFYIDLILLTTSLNKLDNQAGSC